MKTIINTAAVTLDKSLKFYKDLGFDHRIIEGGAYVFDRSVIIFISSTTSQRLGMSLVQSDWSVELEELQKHTDPVTIGDDYLVSDSSGIHIKLLNSHPKLPQSTASAILGDYSGVSLEVIEFNRSKWIWEALGYHQSAGDASHGWIVLSKEDNLSISLIKAGSCPHIFRNPGLNYFNGTGNLEIIKNVRKSGVKIAEEITAFSEAGDVDNVILQDPAGLTFFLFSD